MRILKILFLLNLCWRSQALNITVGEIIEISKLAIDAVKSSSLLYRDVGLSSIQKDRALYKMIKDSNKKIKTLNKPMQGLGFRKEIQNSATKYKLDLDMKVWDLNMNINIINFKYKEMMILIKNKKGYKEHALDKFALCSVTGEPFTIQAILNKTHALIAPSNDSILVEKTSVFQILIDIMKVQGNELFCKMQTSAQQLLLNWYYRLALAEYTGFLMMQFSYRLLTLRNISNFTREIKDAGELYTDWSRTLLNLTLEAVKSVTTELWKCDPEKQVKNITYIEITGFLQAYVENEIDLMQAGHCKKNCSFYKSTRSYHCHNPPGDNRFCSLQRQCKGKIINCQDMEDSRVCFSPEGTNRRYEHIGSEKKVFGRPRSCADEYSKFSRMVRLISVDHCPYCMCFCDEQGINSDRYFSLRASKSTMNRNKVVTGLRFVKKNQIIHLQIQQGKLLPGAKIDRTTVKWKPVGDWRLDDPKVQDGVHYHTLLRNKSNFDLDDLVANEDEEVLTGVRFRMIGSHLSFQIHVTPFNLKSGKLEAERSYWKDKAPKNRTEKVDLSNKDDPVRSTYRNLPTSQSGMYLEFTQTSLAKDIAQTTVPFVDCQAVESVNPVPLSGAGVMYKGSQGYGGFISLKIMTYDFSKVLREAYDDMKVVNKSR